MEGVFLLEIFKPTTEHPEFSVCFLTMDVLLDYVRYNIKDITDDYLRSAHQFAKAKRDVRLLERQILDDAKTLQVSYIPYVKDAKDKTYNQYLSNGREPTVIEEKEEIKEIPLGSTNAISAQEIRNQDKIVDFENSIAEGKYIRLGTFRKLDGRSLYKTSPYTRKPLDRVVTYRARLRGRNYRKRGTLKRPILGLKIRSGLLKK
jgi:hypothetical protein